MFAPEQLGPEGFSKLPRLHLRVTALPEYPALHEIVHEEPLAMLLHSLLNPVPEKVREQPLAGGGGCGV